MKVSVVVFPGTNCDQDVVHVYRKLLHARVELVWHRSAEIPKCDLVVLPGGFSYGDYLRTGALAKVSPIMGAIRRYVEKGGRVIGICNGFQILCEAGLLPGVLLRNIDQHFLSRFVHLKAERNDTFITKGIPQTQILHCPIAHGEGNFFAPPETLRELEGNGQVLFRYCAPDGTIDAENRLWNPNGSANSIAGIINQAGTVVGLMPHPERAVEEITGFVGGSSGRAVFEATLDQKEARV